MIQFFPLIFSPLFCNLVVIDPGALTADCDNGLAVFEHDGTMRPVFFYDAEARVLFRDTDLIAVNGFE